MKLKLAAASLLAVLAPSLVLALGIRLPDQDAAATARGDAFVATADNPSAIFYNPAGITQLDGLSARLGVYTIDLEVKYTPLSGGEYGSKDQLLAVPQAYFVYKPKNLPFAVGLGEYSPFGLSLEFPDTVPFRTLSRKGSLKFFTTNPVIAVEICKGLSIAAGVTINYAEGDLNRGILAPGDNFQFKGSGTSVGFNIGLLWQPHPQHSFGVSYHSASDVTLSGHTDISFTDKQISQFKAANVQIRAANEAIRTIKATVPPQFVPAALAQFGLPSNEIAEVPTHFPQEEASTNLHFPQYIVAGYSFRPTPLWNLEFNLDWTDWDSLNVATLHTQGSGDISLPFNWTSSFMYEFGVTRSFDYGLHASAGYVYSESSVPEASFSPLVPDSNRHIFSVGLGQKLDHFRWDLAYQLAYGPDRRVNNGTLADGTYWFLSNAVTFSLGYDF